MTSGRVYIELVEDSGSPCNISLSGSLLPSAYTSKERRTSIILESTVQFDCS
jgi:hypothetical protein